MAKGVYQGSAPGIMNRGRPSVTREGRMKQYITEWLKTGVTALFSMFTFILLSLTRFVEFIH